MILFVSKTFFFFFFVSSNVVAVAVAVVAVHVIGVTHVDVETATGI